MAYIGDFLVEDGVMRRYIGTGGQVTIPDCVTEIGESSFINCSGVTGVIMQEGVQVIRNAAFSWRTGILSVTMPHSLRVIEEGAFEGCGGLRHVMIPEGVRDIHCAAFHGCDLLQTIEIPRSLESYEDFIEEYRNIAIKAPRIPLRDIPDAYKNKAAHGYAWLIAEERELDEEIHAEYSRYIRDNRKEFYGPAMNSMPLMQYLMKEELIGREDVEKMVSDASEANDFDLTASLLNYLSTIMGKEQLKREDEKLIDELWEF